MDKEYLKNCIKNLEKINDTHQIIEILRKDDKLEIEEKNLIYLYLYPRPLLDMELPRRIMESRKTSGNNGNGYLQTNLVEVALLIEAYRTEQYKRVIKHLLHTFTVPENIHPISGNGQCKCGLCGKNLYEFDAWTSECSKFKNNPHPEESKKEYLAFGGDGSNVSLCLDCIVQLQEVNKILDSLEPGYLNKWKYFS